MKLPTGWHINNWVYSHLEFPYKKNDKREWFMDWIVWTFMIPFQPILFAQAVTREIKDVWRKEK